MRKSMTGHDGGPWLGLLLAALLSMMAGLVAAQEPAPVKPGLMWNKTGLPAVFPLRIKTAPGADYYLQLQHAETGDAALAAYIEGGTFFRVLVPPGTFNLRFASGSVWQGEQLLFGEGSDTQFIALSDPLAFGVKGLATKTGHVVDLTSLARGEEASWLAPTEICQTVHVVYVPVVAGAVVAGHPATLTRAWRPKERPLVPKLEEETVVDRLARSQQVRTSVERERDRAREAARRDLGQVIRVPRYEVRLRPCG